MLRCSDAQMHSSSSSSIATQLGRWTDGEESSTYRQLGMEAVQ
jgi:hypothetical protein